MYGEGIGFQPKDCKSGHDFELWVQGILTTLGFDARLTGGNDNGVDIIATITVADKSYKFYIQCKFHNRPVGKTPVQEVYTGCQYFGGDGYPVVITTNRMSSETKAFAKKMGVEVITEFQLNELQIAVKQKKKINNNLTGLFGLMIAISFKDYDGVVHAVSSYDKKTINNKAPTDKLHSLVSTKLPKEKTPTENKDLGGDTLNCCPKCGSTNYKKHGTKDGRQRYICKDCKKTFSESNATIFYHSKLSTGQWKELLRGMIDRLSTTEISKNVGISQPAVWYNMQKVFEVLAKVYGKQNRFVDIAEADETFTHTSFKGKRNAEYFIKYLRRMPRHQRSREERIEYLMKHGLYDELAQYEPDYLEQLLSDDVLTYDRGISNRD